MKIDFITSLNDSNDIRIRKKFIESNLQLNNKVNYYCVKSRLDDEEDKNLNYIYHKKPTNIIERIYNNVVLTKKVLLDDQNIIQICNPELLPVSFLKLFKKDTLFIFDMHEDFESTILDKSGKKSGKIISKLYKNLLNYSIKNNLDYVFVTTPLIKKKFDFEKVILIENFAPIIEMGSNNNNEDDNLNIIFTGLISKVRGISRILNIIKQYELDFIKFKLVGKISNDYKNELYENFNGYFTLIDSLPYNKMIEEIRNSDVGIIPYLPIKNHLVTRPNKLFEYMMCSTPIICCDFPLYKEVVENNCGVVVNIEDDNDIIEKLNYLYKQKKSNNLKNMGLIGKKMYLEIYNWPKEFNKIKKIYEDDK